MISGNDLKTIAYGLFTRDGFDSAAAGSILDLLDRRELAKFLLFFEKALNERSVVVTSSYPIPDRIRKKLGEMFDGKYLFFAEESGLGGGFSVTAGDDRIDLTVKGYVERALREAGKV